jgi:hypothetical protein
MDFSDVAGFMKTHQTKKPKHDGHYSSLSEDKENTNCRGCIAPSIFDLLQKQRTGSHEKLYPRIHANLREFFEGFAQISED